MAPWGEKPCYAATALAPKVPKSLRSQVAGAIKEQHGRLKTTWPVVGIPGGGFTLFLVSPLFFGRFPFWWIFFRWVVQPPTSISAYSKTPSHLFTKLFKAKGKGYKTINIVFFFQDFNSQIFCYLTEIPLFILCNLANGDVSPLLGALKKNTRHPFISGRW